MSRAICGPQSGQSGVHLIMANKGEMMGGVLDSYKVRSGATISNNNTTREFIVVSIELHW